LTIVGASVRAAAHSAVRGGFTVRAGDLFADVDLRRTCAAKRVGDYPRGLASVVAGPQPGGWMYTGALENHPAIVRRLARIRPLLGNSAEVLARVRDPAAVAEALRGAGLACAEIVRGDRDVPGDARWLRKPLRSAGGLRISVCEAVARGKPRASGGYYFQQYVDGLACSAVYVAAGGNAALVGVTQQLIGARWTGGRAFRYCGSIGPLELSPREAGVFARIGSVLAKEFRLRGLFGVDAIMNQQGVWPVEVNPRYTASTELLDWAYGISAVELHVAACEMGRLPLAAPAARRQVCGKAIVFAARSTVIADDLSRLDLRQLDHPRGANRQDGLIGWPAVADIPSPGTRVPAGGPIVTVLAAASDEDQVLAHLQRQVATINAVISR
jgi:predicted ATP-grasp superfamily ATP-dependent carboligase